MKEKIALVGSTSTVAIYLKKIFEKKYDVITVGRKNADIIYDLRQTYENVFQYTNIDVLILLATQIKAEEDREIIDLFETNVQGQLKLCVAAKNANVRHIVYISSISALILPSKEYYSYYSLSKQYAEKVVDLFCKKNNINLCILRPSQIYGNSELFRNNQPLLYHFLDKAKNNENIIIYGKNDALRNYIYIDDVVHVIEGVIEKKIVGKYDVVNKNVRLSEVASAAIEAYSSSSEIVFDNDKNDIADNSFPFENTIYTILNIGTLTDVQEGIKRIVKRV